MEPYRIVIVGGGSAGWMSAAYLARSLGHRASICVVEAPGIPTVGVGEATFSTIHLFFRHLGLKEEDWMEMCDASYKLAIRFENWNAEGRHFYHPFQRFETVQGQSICEWWLKLKTDPAFDYACFTVPAICDAGRAPRFVDGRVFDEKVSGCMSGVVMDGAETLEDLQLQFPYAYHCDAHLLAEYLAHYAQARHVTKIADEVQSIVLHENGFIRSVVTKSHGLIDGDLFIDCTGFRGTVINKMLNEPFVSFAESLPCDSAVALQIPFGTARRMNPYTTATALSAGWVWEIPLLSRVGTGYVYSSAFLSPAKAEQELRMHLGARARAVEAKHIKMRVGRNRNSWVRNCVAIGLSSGFVEPLESTGIFFIQHAIEQLVSHLPDKEPDEQAIRDYNRLIAECIDGVREFLTLHYAASTRIDTPFWRATKHDIAVPSALAERLSLWRTRLPTNRTINSHYHGFEAYSYCVMLLGLGHRPKGHLPLLNYMDDEKACQVFASIRSKSTRLVNALPPLREYLLSRCSGRRAELESVP